MNINIELQRRPEDYRFDNCVIDVVEEMRHESFETFQNYPTARYGAITNSLHRLPEDTKDERHCILLLDADGDDGFIVNPHGADYARYSLSFRTRGNFADLGSTRRSMSFPLIWKSS